MREEVQEQETARELERALAEAWVLLAEDDDDRFRALIDDDPQTLLPPIMKRVLEVMSTLARKLQVGRPPRRERAIRAGPADAQAAAELWNVGLLTGILWARARAGARKAGPISSATLCAAIERFDVSHHAVPLHGASRQALLDVAHRAVSACGTPTVICTAAWIDGFGVGVIAVNPDGSAPGPTGGRVG